MSTQGTLARPLLAAPEPEDPPALGLVLLAAVVRAALIAVSGLVLVVGVALLLWAVTPATGSEPTSLIRGGVGAFASAHLMPVTIGTATLTLPPLLLTLLFGGFLAAGVARGRVVADGLAAEAACAVLGAAAYTAVVLGAVYLGAPAGAVDMQDGWRAGLFALVAAAIGTAVRGTAWRDAWIGGTPYWLQVGVRTGVAGLMMLVAGGAVALVVALVQSFTTAAAVGEVAAPTAGDAFGMAILGLVYLPTAVLAATGYATGPGFQIGAGTYSPLGSHGVELPAVPLLAAVPPTGAAHLLTLVVFLVPLVAAVVVGVAVVRRLSARSERLLAAGTGGVVAAGVLTALLAVAGGGITGSSWAHLGVPLGWYAVAVALEVGVPAMAWAAVAGWTGVPWRPAVIETADDLEGGSKSGPADGSYLDDDEPDEEAGAARPEVLVWDITEGLPADEVEESELAAPDAAAEPEEGAGVDSGGPSADEAGSAEADLVEPGAEVDEADPDVAAADLAESGADLDQAEPDEADGDALAGELVDGAAAADAASTDSRGQAAHDASVARAFRGHRLLRRRQH